MFKYGVVSGPYFPAFALNTEIYLVNLRIQYEYRKIQTRNDSIFPQFSCCENQNAFQTTERNLFGISSVNIRISNESIP